MIVEDSRFIVAPAGLTLICGDWSETKTLFALNMIGALADRRSGLIVTNDLSRNELKKRIGELVTGSIALRAMVARDELISEVHVTLSDAVEGARKHQVDVLLLDGLFRTLPFRRGEDPQAALTGLLTEFPRMVLLGTTSVRPTPEHWLCRLADTVLLVRSHRQRVMAACLMGTCTGQVMSYRLDGFTLAC